MSDYKSVLVNLDAPTKDGKSSKDKELKGSDQEHLSGVPDVFKINDISLVIPPSSIGVHKEDMVWSWKTLRVKAATKVPSGRGVCHVTLSVVFTPDLLLHLHRLIIQFQHSPFCWIENDYLRESIVPSWTPDQQMAFTLSNLTLRTMAGSPGTFICELDLRWFNYLPYSSNYLYRDEWKTLPIGGRQYTIPMYGAADKDNRQLTEIARAFPYHANDTTRVSASIVSPDSPTIKRANDITISLIEKNRSIETFDLSPGVQMTQRAGFVMDPALSRIYVRYINTLQQKALFENFDFDIASKVIASQGSKFFNRFTYGLFEGRGLVKGWHTKELPTEVRNAAVAKMMSYMPVISFIYNEYKTIKPGKDVQDAINAYKKAKKEAQIKNLFIPSDEQMQAYKNAENAKGKKERILSNYNASATDRIKDAAKCKENQSAFIVNALAGNSTNQYTSSTINWSLFTLNPGLKTAYETLSISLNEAENSLDTSRVTSITGSIKSVENAIAKNDSSSLSNELKELSTISPVWIVSDKLFHHYPNYEKENAVKSQILHMKYYPPTINAELIPKDTSDGTLEYTSSTEECLLNGAPVFSPEAGEVTDVRANGSDSVENPKTWNIKISIEGSGHIWEFANVGYKNDWVKKGTTVKRGETIGYIYTVSKIAGIERNKFSSLEESSLKKNVATLRVTDSGGRPENPFELYTETQTEGNAVCAKHGEPPVAGYWPATSLNMKYDGMEFGSEPTNLKPQDFMDAQGWSFINEGGPKKEPLQHENLIIYNLRAMAHILDRLSTIVNKKTGQNVKLRPTNRGASGYVYKKTSRPKDTSMHYTGRAADISHIRFKGDVTYNGETYTTKEDKSWVLYDIISKAIKDRKIPSGGLGLYTDFIHYDFRSWQQNVGREDPNATKSGVFIGGGHARWVGSTGVSKDAGSPFAITNARDGWTGGAGGRCAPSKQTTNAQEVLGNPPAAIEESEAGESESELNVSGKYTKRERPKIHAVNTSCVPFEITPPKKVKAAKTEALKKSEGLSEFFNQLIEAGWSPYESDLSVKNVWVKSSVLIVQSDNSNWPLVPAQTNIKIPEDTSSLSLTTKSTGVVTDVAASLTHAVASIPIIGQEFPTHQHLGSIEPSYNIQLSLMTGESGPNGLGDTGKALEKLRAHLQANARDFRPIRDAWTLTADHFTTRLFGTYGESDLMVENGQYVIKKRACISAMDVQTREGSPGTSIMSMGLLETNPRVEESIEGTLSSNGVPINERRKRILKALHNQTYKKSDEGKEQALYDLANRYGKIVIGTSDNQSVEDIVKSEMISPIAYTDGGRKIVSKYRRSTPGSMSGEELKKAKAFMRDGRSYAIIRANTVGSGNAGGFVSDLSEKNDQKISNEKAFLKGIDMPYKEVVNIATTYENKRIVDDHIGTDRSADGGVEALQTSPAIAMKDIVKKIKALNLERKSFGVKKVTTTTRSPGALVDIAQEIPEGLIIIDVTDIQRKNGIRSYTTNAKTGIGQILKKDQAYQEALSKIINLAETIMVEDFVLEDADLQMDRDLYGLKYEPRMYSTFKYWMFAFQYAQLADKGFANRHFNSYLNSYNKVTKEEVKKLWEDSMHESNGWSERWARTSEFYGVVIGDTKSKKQRVRNASKRGDRGFESFEEWGSDTGSGGFFGQQFTKALDIFRSQSSEAENLLEEATKESQKRVNFYVDNVIGNMLPSLSSWLNNELNFLAPYIYVGDEEGGVLDWKSTQSNQDFGLYPQLDLLWWWWFCPKNDDDGNNIADSKAKLFRRYPEEYYDFLNLPKEGVRNYKSQSARERNSFNPPIGVNKSFEDKKVRYIKERLAALADEIFGNPIWMKSHGLQELYMGSDGVNPFKGSDCYPDMSLPSHPYYSEGSSSSPDFYMWNIYEDAGAQIRGRILKEVENQVDPIVRGSYNFMKKLQKRGLANKKDLFRDTLNLFESSDIPGVLPVSRLSHHPEGSDELDTFEENSVLKKADWKSFLEGQGKNIKTSELPQFTKGFLTYGPTSFAFDFSEVSSKAAPGKYSHKFTWTVEDEEDIDPGLKVKLTKKVTVKKNFDLEATTVAGVQIIKSLQKDIEKNLDTTKTISLLESINLENKLRKTKELIEKIEEASEKFSVPFFSVTDMNSQYLVNQRVSGKKYEEYQQALKKIGSIENMFGSRAGYTGEYISSKNNKSKDIAKALGDTAVGALSNMNHSFDLDSLKKLTKDSARDIISQKYSMKRAYPTFKLFFVEEDENESRWLNFDDFYSFNGVKEFTVHRSRKNAADTATITLQNIAGTLDGTKRNAIVDMDYLATNTLETQGESAPLKFKKSVREEREKKELDKKSTPRESNKNKVDSSSLPFQAVILRQGMNVQLRCGYSNDPDNLEVLISGRLTDITWNKTGDLTEIVVQSFGTELVQQIKSSSNTSNEDDLFPTTHHLLGNLMLSPELKHFGRWEHGQLFQLGESQDARFDFHDYTRDSTWSFGVTSGFADWVSAHPIASLALAGVASVAAMLPYGRIGAVGKAAMAARGSATAVRLPTRVFNWVGGKLGTNRALNATGRFIFGGFSGLKATPKVLAATKDGGLIRSTASILSTTAGRGGVALEAKAIAAVEKQLLAEMGLGSATALGASRAGFFGRLFGKGGAGALEGTAGDIISGTVKGAVSRMNTLAKFPNAKSWPQPLANGTWPGAPKAVVEAFKGTGIAYKTIHEAAVNGTTRQLLAKHIAKTQLMPALQYAQLNAHTQAFGYLFGQSALKQTALITPTLATIAQGTGAAATFGSRWAGVGGLALRSFGTAARGTAVIGGGILAAELVYEALIEPLITQKINRISNEYRRHKAYMRLSPSDDNLFPPNPAAYMKLTNQSGLGSTLRKLTNAAGQMIIGTNAGNAVSKLYTALNSDGIPAKILDKRMKLEDAKYELSGKNIWEIFHEMSLRHPGWVYANRPYGKKFEYRMFFGVPSQRYWSKPYSNAKIHRLNTIRGHFYGARSIAKGMDKSKFISLYGNSVYNEIKARADSEVFVLSTVGSEFTVPFKDGVDPYPDYTKFWTNLNTLSSPENRKALETAKQVRIKNEMNAYALKEYISGLEDRFVPFRRYHLVSSNTDIVANNIISSEHNVVNAVNVIYTDTHSSSLQRISQKLKASTSIPEEMIRMETINYPNCKGYSSSLRYGQGHLLHTMKDMYRGELMLVGNPRIRPWDVCMLMDSYNDMAGPVVVEAVTHIFSHETGYLTEIKPNAFTVANEISSWPILQGLKLFAMAQKDVESGGLSRKRKEKDFTGLAEKADSFDGSFWSVTLGDWSNSESKKRWLEIVKKNYPDDLSPKIFPGYEDTRMNFSFRQDAKGSMQKTVDNTARVSGALLATTGFIGLRKLLKADKWDTAWKLAKRAGGLGVRSVPVAAGGYVAIDESPTKTASWLISGTLLLAKCMEEEVIAVVPLTKAGRPIVSGLHLRDPLLSWKQEMGKVTNTVVDTIVGTEALIDDWSATGAALWRYTKGYFNESEKIYGADP